jgi:hypothetical protein
LGIAPLDRAEDVEHHVAFAFSVGIMMGSLLAQVGNAS